MHCLTSFTHATASLCLRNNCAGAGHRLCNAESLEQFCKCVYSIKISINFHFVSAMDGQMAGLKRVKVYVFVENKPTIC